MVEPKNQTQERAWIHASHDGQPHKNRRLILCFDGTGNQFSTKNSNVLQFFRCLQKDDGNQIVYYQTGIGPYTNSSFFTEPVIELSMALDAAFGWNLIDHVQDAYRFLMQNYKPGDKVSLFGFSRGAYTARVFCGFVQKVGLLPPENHRQIPFAWEIFKRSDNEGGWEQCKEYKKAFSMHVVIDFLGLWDTVAALGISGRELPFSKPTDGAIRVFRQALSLDERRAKFTPNFKLTVNGTETAPDTGFPGKCKASSDEFLARRFREVWFAGCHSDVGGGSVENSTRNSLARIPLRWMIRECFRMDTGIVFDKRRLVEVGFNSVPFRRKSRTDRQSMQDSWGEKRTRPRFEVEQTSWLQVAKSVGRDLLALVLLALRLLAVVLFPFAHLSRLISHLPSVQNLTKKFRKTRVEANIEGEDIRRLLGYVPNDAEDERIDVNEKDEDRYDALSPIYDQLAIKWWFWSILELLPIIFRVQNSAGGKRDQFVTRFNLWQGRKIYGDGWNIIAKQNRKRQFFIEVHQSVLTRMLEYEDYKPQAWFSIRKGQDFRWSKYEDLEKTIGWKWIKWVDG